eukprot:GHRR01009861.1.p1 GENE.GHRR01009861.1~~GHRR01009861.1.p1  ORF type:complete len:626 (+),score=158.82 GHRR01009861.1:171-2048(+)
MGCAQSKVVSKDIAVYEATCATTASAPTTNGEVPSAQQPEKPIPAAAAPAADGIAEGQSVVTPSEEALMYYGACSPICEIARRQHLLDMNIMNTAPESRFDDITKLCCMVFKVPIALVSLVDEKVQWFKSVQGLPGVDHTPRNMSFCAWTLLPAYPEALVVEDALLDARFKDNPLVVGAPYIRFYAGCPLVCSNGMRLGSLCIIDKNPRSFDAESCNMLANMAEMVIREIERDKALEEQRLQQERAAKGEQTHKQLLRAIDCFTEAIMLVDMSGDNWSIMFANESWESVTGGLRTPGHAINFWSVFQVPASAKNSQSSVTEEFSEAIANQQNFELLVSFAAGKGVNTYCGTGPRCYAMAQFRCAANTGLDKHMPLIAIPNFLPNTHDSSHSFYFTTLKELPMGLTSNGSQSLPMGTQSMAPFSLMAGNEPFADIKLGPLLGKGAFGRVYRGTWNGKMVAVKVIEYTQQQNEGGGLLEGLLSEQVQHPHVVRTFKHITRPLPMANSDDDLSMDTNGLPSSCSREQMMETWLVLEFCNRGCIADAVEKGWFRKRGSRFEPDMRTILGVAYEVASALAYLHSMNILHADLTGNNVLLTVNADSKCGFMAKVSRWARCLLWLVQCAVAS